MSQKTELSSKSSAQVAYKNILAGRPVREQQAEVFLRVNAALKKARETGDPSDRVRALADNKLLWMMIINLQQDNENPLPLNIRASLVSIGLSVMRAMEAKEPNLGFLIEVNTNIADGLMGKG